MTRRYLVGSFLVTITCITSEPESSPALLLCANSSYHFFLAVIKNATKMQSQSLTLN